MVLKIIVFLSDTNDLFLKKSFTAHFNSEESCRNHFKEERGKIELVKMALIFY